MRNCTTSRGPHPLVVDALIVKQASKVCLERERGALMGWGGGGWGVLLEGRDYLSFSLTERMGGDVPCVLVNPS